MRITIGIKIVIGCVLAMIVALSTTSYFQQLQVYDLLSVLAGIAAGTLVVLAVAWHIHSRFKALLAAFQALTEEKFDKLANPLKGRDELFELGHSLEQFSCNFKQRVQEMGENISKLSLLTNRVLVQVGETLREYGKQDRTIRQLTSQVNDIFKLIQNVYEKIGDLSRRIGSTSESIETLNTAITDEYNKVDSASKISQEAVNAAREGTNVVREMEDGIGKIATNVQNAAQTIEKLGKSSDEIGEIIGVIDDIADQTNLLALNAAIEAARAGEQGRGFAVVADSVRNLAEKTQKATKEIVVMIKNLQGETAGAVGSMKGGTKEVESGVTMAARAGTTLKNIASSVEKVNELMSQIQEHSRQQEKIKQKISTSTTDIVRIAQDLSGSIGGQQQSCLNLKKDVEDVDIVSSKSGQCLSEIRRDLEEMAQSIFRVQGFYQHFAAQWEYIPAQVKEQKVAEPKDTKNALKENAQDATKSENIQIEKKL